MTVVRERLGEPLPLHDRHRATIREAVVLIKSRFIKPECLQKRRMSLTDDRHIRVVEKGPYQLSGLLPGPRACGATKRQEFRKDFFCSVETARTNRLAKSLVSNPSVNQW